MVEIKQQGKLNTTTELRNLGTEEISRHQFCWAISSCPFGGGSVLNQTVPEGASSRSLSPMGQPVPPAQFRDEEKTVIPGRSDGTGTARRFCHCWALARTAHGTTLRSAPGKTPLRCRPSRSLQIEHAHRLANAGRTVG